MLAEEIKNKLSDLATRGINDWESPAKKNSYRANRKELPARSKLNSSNSRTVQLKLFEK